MRQTKYFSYRSHDSHVVNTDAILQRIRNQASEKRECSEFAGMVDLLYRSREKEVIIEEALEMVRISTLAMHKSEQLAETAEVMFEQFRLLGKIPDRMGIGIIDEETKMVKLWVTDQKGDKLNHEFFFSLQEPTSMAKIYGAWKQGKEMIVIDLKGQDLKNWLRFAKKEARLPIDETKIHGRRVQQAAFFRRGFLLFTTHEPVSGELMQLLVRFARVFDLTYTRFLDLQKAEAQAREAQSAKQSIEATLTELRATQAQLIQSEKMASLGELTSGIAHELLNPLNFVNNFSEVNEDLIAEIREAIDKGDSKEAQSIAGDIEENEKKINYHGKRADAIVKGMMQHSRKRMGEKMLTDLNALTNEFLILSYDGVRARDNSFSAILKSDLDPAIGKINIVPQDIGLVLMNLYNNAFYAMSVRKKKELDGYQPAISVCTKKTVDTIEVHVKDNAEGIPQKIIGKIFQPFFTTKPAGEGVGLGLSLSYDIIKMHGGELKVNSREKIGTEFILQLPYNL